MDEGSSQRFCTINCHDIVNVVEFAPLESCSSLLAVGTNSRITVFQYFNEPEYDASDNDQQNVLYRQLVDIQHSCRVTSLSWCPTSSYRCPEVMDNIKFAAAGSDHKIRVFTTQLQNTVDRQIIEGHTGYINSIAYSPEHGEILASTGDDMTCRIWNPDGEQQCCFQLGAAGMSVNIHTMETRKVMVAQKNGLIKIFSLDLQQQIMSCDCRAMPLMAADWCHEDEDLVAAVAGTEWFIFQLSRSSQPIERRLAHTDGVRDLRWSKSHPTLLATMGRPGRQIKVFSTRHHQVPLSTSLPVAYGMSWHYHYPILAVGGDRKVELYHCDPNKTDAR